MLRPLAEEKSPPTRGGTPVQSPRVGTVQRVKFWGTLLIILASLATVTFWIRSRQSRVWTNDAGFGPVIGIDIGNTYARVGYTTGDFTNVKVFQDSHGNTSIPTCVAFTDTEILVGHADTPYTKDALQQARLNPERTVCNVQRYLYFPWSSREVQLLLPNLPYPIFEGENGGVAVQMTIAGKVQTYKPTELVGILLGRLRNLAETALGEKVTNAVLTVPADLDMEAHTPLKAAAALAGLSVPRIVREPVTVAMAYGVDRTYGERKIVVLDMGGESLQVSAWEIDDGVFDMLSVVTRPVGGWHFNERVVEHLWKKFSRKNGITVPDITEVSPGKLFDAVEMAKRRLSTSMSTRIEIPDFYKSLSLNETLTRAKFEELNKDLFESTLEALQTSLDKTKLKPNEIDDVIFSGGSSFIPKMRFDLEMFFNKKHQWKIADEAVVTGAAIYGALLSGHEDSGGCPVDVHPLSIGIETADGVTFRVIPKFTAIPTRKSVKIMAPRRQGEESKVIVNVIEGERFYARNNRLLGELDITSILSPTDSAEPADVLSLAMELDANGILEVIALNPATKKETRRRRASQTRAYDDARDNQLVESMLSDGEKHADVEYPLMQQYTKIVDLQSFALAVKKEVLAKTVLPEAARENGSMRQVLKAAEAALAWRLDKESIVSPLDQIEEAKFTVERIVENLLIHDLSYFQYDQVHRIGGSSTVSAADTRDEL
ncbi:heat shock 70 kDa protein [Apiospora marii]|uniref:Heat shock 70 kDa protein n=1 Tax=Apiospora marii TaxID=335849 RepID=A0ABR1R8V5_9PEZI